MRRGGEYFIWEGKHRGKSSVGRVAPLGLARLGGDMTSV